MRKLMSLCMALVLIALPSDLICGGGPASADPCRVFLTVSQIMFSVVGESEAIYAGTAPLEQVQWESDDPGIVSVENGVLTAVGVGTTTIHAKFGSQHVTCTTGCLAEDRSELLKLPPRVLQEPKRIPTEVNFDPSQFFGDAVLIGDSVSYNMMVHELTTGLLGHPTILARKNVGVFNFVNYIINVNFRGEEYHVEDAIPLTGAKKVFFMLGVNDVGYQTPEELTERYGILIDRIQENAPDVTIYIQTCIPRYTENNHFAPFNDKIDEFNRQMTQMAQSKGCVVLDLAAYIKNHGNGMAEAYTLDRDAHLNYEGSVVWMNMLRAYAYSQILEENYEKNNCNAHSGGTAADRLQ